MLRSILILAPGVALTLGAAAMMAYQSFAPDPAPAGRHDPVAAVASVASRVARLAGAEPVALSSPAMPAPEVVAVAEVAASSDGLAAPPAEEPPSRPAVRHGAEGLGGAGGFACGLMDGVRRCRLGD